MKNPSHRITTGSFRLFAALLALVVSAAAHGRPPGDNIPPTTPTNLQVTAVSPTSVSLVWGPSTDNSGSLFYVIYRNNQVVANASMSNPSITITGLNSSTTYNFKVRARDYSMNWSGYSNQVSATTLPANTPPTPPVLSAPSVGPTHTKLSWTAPANGAPSFRYWIYRDGVEIITWHQTESITFYNQAPGVTHTYTVKVRTGTGLFSALSNPITITTPQPDPNDNSPPSTPTNLWANTFGDAEFWLTWTQSTDNVTPQAYIRYDVYVNGELSDIHFVIGPPNSAPNSINYGIQGQWNTIEVIAVDEAGNQSEPAVLLLFL